MHDERHHCDVFEGLADGLVEQGRQVPQRNECDLVLWVPGGAGGARDDSDVLIRERVVLWRGRRPGVDEAKDDSFASASRVENRHDGAAAVDDVSNLRLD